MKRVYPGQPARVAVPDYHAGREVGTMAREITVTVSDDGPNESEIDTATEQLADATDALEATNTDVVDTLVETDHKMDDVSEQLSAISERLNTIEGRLPPDPPDDPPSPAPEPDPLLTPNSPTDQAPDPVPVVVETPPDDIVSPGKDDKDIAPVSSGSEDDDESKGERKKDKKPRQKLGWKAYVLGGSGGRR